MKQSDYELQAIKHNNPEQAKRDQMKDGILAK